MSHCFEHGQGRELIKPEIKLGIGGARGDVGICSHVEDRVKSFLRKKRVQSRPVKYVQLKKSELRYLFEVHNIAPVAEMKIVDTANLGTHSKQAIAKVAADEARSARHENSHS